MENKMTAIEYTFQRIHDLIHESNHVFLADLYESMVELEKQQIINAANISKEERWYDGSKYNSTGEKYYSETYKK